MSVNGSKALIEAKPPATDHMTYLTIVEYNLSPDVLPTLHEILQDPELTANIGWDLVLLLLPLLPESQACLQDVARLGNPREVVLKVTEALRLLDFDAPDGNEDDDEDDDGSIAVAGVGLGISENSLQGSSTTPAQESKTPLPVVQFHVLLSMLSILHPRIRTKYPSRFLSTSLEAVLLAYRRSGAQAGLLTESIIKFVKQISGTKRPHLPSRTSSGMVLTSSNQQGAPDPEGTDDAVSTDEKALQQKLLQSFISHVVEDYLTSLGSDDDVPGMAWSSRLQEKLHRDKIPDIPGRVSAVDRFAGEEPMQLRSSTVGQIVAIADDLGLRPSQLLETVLEYDPAKEDVDHGGEPPAAAEDVPFSDWGALFLFAANAAAKALYGHSSPPSPISIFPHHARVMDTYFANPANKPEASVDATLFLGILALETGSVGNVPDEEAFNNYLLKTSFLAANTPSPSLRYHALRLTSAVLHAHPSEIVRLSFISDTLEHCPYENLKASAVGWLKDEIIAANLSADRASLASDQTPLFATPVALHKVAEHLFPDLSVGLGPATSLPDAWAHFNENGALHLARLSFYYFLLRAAPLHDALDIASLHKTSDVGGSYLAPLRAAVERLARALGDAELQDDEMGRAAGELELVQESIERIEEEVKKMQ